MERAVSAEVGDEMALPPRGARSPPTLVVAPDDDLRLLLRGLLALYRHRVVGEGPSLAETLSGGSAGEAVVLVYAPNPRDGDAVLHLANALRSRPDLATLVILTPEQEAARGAALEAGARAVLARPFRLRELAQALDELRAPSPADAVALGRVANGA